jgi:hypothetical protein
VKNRWIAIALALLGAGAFALSVQMGRWWVIGDVEIGPFGSRHCFDGQCRGASLSWLGGDPRWIRFGIATWAAGLLAMLVLVMMAAGLAARRIPRLVAKSVLVTIATGTVTATVFVTQFPGMTGAALARGVWVFALAVLLGTISAVWVVRSRAAG